MARKTSEQWVAEYALSHQHPVNRACHTVGIPTIVLSLILFALVPWMESPRYWLLPLTLFVIGWILQFVGHWYERKPPEFFKDPRFLFVGLRWWLAKMRGRA